MKTESFDHIILGTGQATGTLLGRLIDTGDRIAVIEAEKVGGSCVNYGCTPTKTLVASARAFHQARRGSFFGFDAGDPRLDYTRVRERMNEIRNESREGLADWMQETDNVTLIRGRGVFVSEKILEAGGRRLTADKIYINVGTRPRIPDIPGLQSVEWMDSARLLEKKTLPEHLLILGGGYVGVEFAQIYRRFGCEVTLIQRSGQLMPREDADVAEGVQELLEKEGVRVIVNADTQKVAGSRGALQLHLQISGGEAGGKGEQPNEKNDNGKVRTEVVTGSDLLVAAGRLPNSDTIRPDAAGIELDKRGYIQVNDTCETGIPGVYALGDVNGQGAFTHTAVNDAEIALDHLFGGKRTLSMRNTIYALFTDPPLGRVGMTEKQAREAGKKVLVATRPMSRISRAKEMGETRGFAKLLVDADTDLILGAAILGPGGDEIINMFAAIMHSQVPCREYRRVVLVHPTVSELMPFILDGIREARDNS